MSGKSKSEDKNNRAERISGICAAINKTDFGGQNHDAVTWVGSQDAVVMERFSSGCVDLDEALGGGWPKGRFVELYGPESGGKTTLALHAIAEHQKKYPDEDVALIDSEFAWDAEYAVTIGVDTKYLIVHQPENGVQALNVLEQLIKGGVSLIVVDSVAALTTADELAGDIGDVTVGAQARLMSGALRRLTGEAGKRKATVFWTNQLREKIGVTWGDNTTTPAGRALKHYASVRVSVRSWGKVKEGEEIVSSKTKADVKKNKTAPPFRVAEFNITFGIGIDVVASVLDTAIAMGVINKKGSWLSFDGNNLGQGRAVVLDMMRNDEEMVATISKAMEEAKGAGVKPETQKKANIKRPKGSDGKDTTEDVDAIDTPEVGVEDV